MNAIETGRSVGLRMPPELRWFLGISAALWIVSLAYIGLSILLVPGQHHGLPGLFYSHFFTDLTCMAGKFAVVHQPEFFNTGYRWNNPAPSVLLYKFLYQFPFHSGNEKMQDKIHAVAIYTLLAVAGLALLISRMIAVLTKLGLSRRDSRFLMIAATLLSWPIFLALHQGNSEGILWIGVALGIWAYYRGMWWTSALLIGFVAGFKIYPILLLALFLKPRKYRQIAAGVAVFGAFTLISLAYIGPTVPIAYHKVALGMKIFTDAGFYPAPLDRDYLTFDHSLVSLIGILTTGHPDYMVTLSSYFMPIGAVVMIAFFFAFVWRKPRLNQLLVILLAIVLLTPKSYDYTLQMLYIPWAWLCLLAVSAAHRGAKTEGMLPVMVCLALVSAPEFFINYQGNNYYGQFKTICLLVLLGLAARYRFSDPPHPMPATAL